MVLNGFLASTIYHQALEGMGQSYPFTSFLFRPGDRFADLTRRVTVELDAYPRLEAGGGNAFPLAIRVSGALLRPGTMTGVAVLAETHLIASIWCCLLSMGGDSRLEKIRDARILCCLGGPRYSPSIEPILSSCSSSTSLLVILVKSARRHRPIHLLGAPADGAERSF